MMGQGIVTIEFAVQYRFPKLHGPGGLHEVASGVAPWCSESETFATEEEAKGRMFVDLTRADEGHMEARIVAVSRTVIG